MPASSTDSLLHIQETLKASLGGSAKEGTSLEQRLLSSSKKILLQKIEFQAAERTTSYMLDTLRTKYTSLNPQTQNSENGCHGQNQERGMSKMNGKKENSDGIPLPAVILCSPDKVKLQWNQTRKIGSGLMNMGNTCFLNSTLQCLTYTAPLTNYLLSNSHTSQCRIPGFCMMCELSRHTRRCFENNGHPLKPQSILQKLKFIAKHMRWGRQEDAHEFLRYVIDAMQKTCLDGHSKLDRYSKETTIVNHIFGGFFRNQVMCMKCKEKSNTYDPFMDISLDVKNMPSIQKAFEKFVQPDTLDNENAYNCPHCKQKVRAQKRFSIHRAPNILTVQLKRFDYNRYMGGKVTRHIQFPEKLNIRPYMSQRQGDAMLYQLYAVLVHSGMTCNSGHYYCYTKASNQTWYCMNDSMVHSTSVERVLNAEAYLLLYTKTTSSVSKQLQRPTSGPQMPIKQSTTKQFMNPNGAASQPSHELGVPLARKNGPSHTVSSSRALPAHSVSTSVSVPSTIPPVAHRDKVSFGIKLKDSSTPGNASAAEQPRLVMHIKNGRIAYNSVSPTTQRKLDAKGIDPKSTAIKRLVPYNDGDSSDSDKEKATHDKKSIKSEDHLRTGRCNGNKVNPKASQEPQMDFKLNATLNVPGAYKPLDGKEKQVFSQHKSEHRQESRKSFELKLSPSNGSSSNLSVITSPKLKATTPWHVLDQESQASPSLASDSSAGSVNSTTEWNISEKRKKGTANVVPGAQCYGWTVTPSPTKNPSISDIFSRRTSEENGTLHQDYNIKMKKYSESCKISPKQENKQFERSIKKKDSLVPETSSYPGINGGNHSQNISSQETFSKSSIYCKTVDDKLSTNSAIGINAIADQAKQSSVDDSDSGYHSNKKKKKHKKHKKHKDKSAEDDERSHKKHKKLKKMKKKRLSEQGLLSSDEDQGKTSESDDKSVSNSKVVWVEKTKDNFEKLKNFTSKENTSTKSGAPSQDWDHHMKSPTNRNKHEGQGEGSNVKSKWDGSRSSAGSIVHELERMSSAHGYGAQVSSWDGNLNHVDQTLLREKDRKNKRGWQDAYEEELDQGKAKKVKRVLSDQSFGTSDNPFQRSHEDKKRENHDHYRKDRRHSSENWHRRKPEHDPYDFDRHDTSEKHERHHSYRHQSQHRNDHRIHHSSSHSSHRERPHSNKHRSWQSTHH